MKNCQKMTSLFTALWVYSTTCIKKKFFSKNPLNFCSLKVKKISDGVKNKSAMLVKHKLEGASPPASLGLRVKKLTVVKCTETLMFAM